MNYVIVLEFIITCILGVTKKKLRNLQFWINERQRRVLRPSVWNFLKAVVILQVAESGMFLHKSGIFWHLSLAFPLDIHCWIQHLQISIKHKEIHFKITLNHFVHLTHISHKYKNKESERDKGNKKKNTNNSSEPTVCVGTLLRIYSCNFHTILPLIKKQGWEKYVRNFSEVTSRNRNS